MISKNLLSSKILFYFDKTGLSNKCMPLGLFRLILDKRCLKGFQSSCWKWCFPADKCVLDSRGNCLTGKCEITCQNPNVVKISHPTIGQGYHYEHRFSYDWNTMKGYHPVSSLLAAMRVLK